jgi:hypothetical protein
MNRGYASDIGIFLLKRLAGLPFRFLYFCSDILYYEYITFSAIAKKLFLKI